MHWYTGGKKKELARGRRKRTDLMPKTGPKKTKKKGEKRGKKKKKNRRTGVHNKQGGENPLGRDEPGGKKKQTKGGQRTSAASKKPQKGHNKKKGRRKKIIKNRPKGSYVLSRTDTSSAAGTSEKNLNISKNWREIGTKWEKSWAEMNSKRAKQLNGGTGGKQRGR